jgi:hypothetical protein
MDGDEWPDTTLENISARGKYTNVNSETIFINPMY